MSGEAPQAGPTPSTEGGGTATLVLGVSSILVFLTRIPFLWLVAVGLAVAAIVSGWRRFSPERPATGRGLALTGMCLGIVALTFGLLVLFVPFLDGI